MSPSSYHRDNVTVQTNVCRLFVARIY